LTIKKFKNGLRRTLVGGPNNQIDIVGRFNLEIVEQQLRHSYIHLWCDAVLKSYRNIEGIIILSSVSSLSVQSFDGKPSILQIHFVEQVGQQWNDESLYGAS